MPRYFFAIHDHQIDTDEVGTELADPFAARIEAIRYAGEVLRDQPQLLDNSNTISVQVTDETGAEAFRLEMRAVDPGL